MNIDDLFKDLEYGNFVCVYFGLAYVGQILEPYTRNGLQQVHQKIQRTLAGNPKCAGTCGKDRSRWCNSCKDWQRELIKFRKYPDKIDWKKQESSKWPVSYEHIASVFMSTPGDGGPVNLRDLSNTCSIWTNCNKFNIGSRELNYVKESRNNYFAHNDTLRVTEIEKAKAFDALYDLLKQGDVQNHINKQECLNELDRIKNDNYLPMEIALISENIKKISNDEDKIIKILTELTGSGTEERKVLERKQDQVFALHERQRQEHVFVKARLDLILNILQSNRHYIKYLCAAFCIIAVSLLVFISQSYLQSQQRNLNVIPFSIGSKCSGAGERYVILNLFYLLRFHLRCLLAGCPGIIGQYAYFGDMLIKIHYDCVPSILGKITGCLSESYKYPFPLEVRMLEFLPYQNNLVGREWVFDALEQKMFEKYTKSRGTLMTAGYGFGKSAIVAHLLCARENEKGWKLRQHIVAFHVCKFKHESTKNPVLLIKRLIWFLSIKSAEYGSYIALLENSIIDDDEKCKNDTRLCFDHAITNPLDKLTVPNDAPWIVVIDALDECADDNGRNRILELLADRLIFMQQEGPKWFKWFITSRNMTSLNKLNKLDTVHLLYDDERNYDDIRHFIINQLNIFDFDLVDGFVYKSGGNILYIKHALEYIIESGNVSIHNIVNLPSGIGEIYELNFERLFKTNNDFEVAKSILQVISVDMFHTAELFRIIEANKVTDKAEFIRIMDKLSFFVAPDDYVTFRHKSLYDWLISDTKSSYRISLRLGHVMVSEYLFDATGLHATDLSPSLDYYGHMYFSAISTKLTFHVSESQNSYLQRRYFSLQLSRCIFCYECLQRYKILSQDIRSVKMLKLMVNFVINKTVENNTFFRFIRNVYRYSMEFTYNRVDAVSFLYENVTNAKGVLRFPLHKAAKHCHEDVALYLINVVKVSLLERDNKCLRAIDVAAKTKCMPVLKLITKKDRSVLDMECLMNLGSMDTKTFFEINKELVANRIKPSCLDTTFQKEMLMRIYLKRHKKYQCVRYFLMIFFKIEPVFMIPAGHCNYRYNAAVNFFTGFHPELLSCSDIDGYTPALRFITTDARNSFSAILEKGINDKCQPVSNSMLYMFYSIIQNSFSLEVKDILNPFKYNATFCPEGASVEHLLMRYKRIEMINLVIANGYIMNLTKTDWKGKTPLDYVDQMFIMQLECQFGVDIHVLSDKDKLDELCLCGWFYFYFLLVMYAIACCIACFYWVVLYSIKTILCKVAFL